VGIAVNGKGDTLEVSSEVRLDKNLMPCVMYSGAWQNLAAALSALAHEATPEGGGEEISIWDWIKKKVNAFIDKLADAIIDRIVKRIGEALERWLNQL